MCGTTTESEPGRAREAACLEGERGERGVGEKGAAGDGDDLAGFISGQSGWIRVAVSIVTTAIAISFGMQWPEMDGIRVIQPASLLDRCHRHSRQSLADLTCRAPDNPSEFATWVARALATPELEESEALKVRVLYHDRCFDGACSASLFTRFHRECIGTAGEYEYHGLVHRAGALFQEEDFSGDENAIVDFKYSTSPRITWWFDHHLSAFLSPEDHAQYLRGIEDGSFTDRRFYDPNYTSCTSFIAHIAETRFGFDAAPVAELIHWADIVDGALYESAEAAVEMAAPAMKLTLIIESSQDPEFIPRLIPLLTAKSLDEVLREPFVACSAASAAGAAPGRDCADPRALDGDGGDDLLRHRRPAAGGVQQVHSVLSSS